jgi:hypothetical protein
MTRIVDITEQTFTRIMNAVKKLESAKTMRGESKIELTFRRGSGGQVWAKTPDGVLTYGGSSTEPGVAVTALTDVNTSFRLATAWGGYVTAPQKRYGFWNKVGSNYYQFIDTYYIKINAAYPTSGGVTSANFSVYLEDKATTLLTGTNSVLPAGCTAVLDGFVNASAHVNVRTYFSGKIFVAKYDSANNIFYITHPRY